MEKAPIIYESEETTCFQVAQRDADHKYYLKQFVEWYNEPCIMHGDSDKRVREGKLLRQGHCYQCFQALLKEAGEDNE